jgi:hypothetical protein
MFPLLHRNAETKLQGVFMTKKFAKQTLAQFTKSDNYVCIGERRAWVQALSRFERSLPELAQ